MSPFSPPYTLQPPALTAGEVAALLRPASVAAYLSFSPSNPQQYWTPYMATAQVDLPTGWPGGTVNYTNIPIKNKSVYFDTFANKLFGPLQGFLVYIGTTPGAHDVGIFRTRNKDWTGVNYLYVEEIGIGDVGLVPLQNQASSIANNNYITMFVHRMLWPALTRIDFSGGGSGVFYKDYDLAYGGQNSIASLWLNLGPHIAGFVSPSTGKLRVSITPQMSYIPQGYHWCAQTNNVPIGCGTDNNPIVYSWQAYNATVIRSGAFSDTGRLYDQPITGAQYIADYSPGFNIVVCTATYTIQSVPPGLGTWLTIGQVLTWQAVRYIWAHDGILGVGAPVFPAIPISAIDSDSSNPETRSMSVRVNDTTWNNYEPGTLVHYWETPDWGGQDVFSATKSFTGFIEKVEQHGGQSGLKESTISILGVGAMLDRIPASSNRLDDLNTYYTGTTPTRVPSTWQEWIQPYPESFLYYLLYWHVANLATLFDFNKLDNAVSQLGAINWLWPMFSFNVNAGSIWSQVKSAARRWTTEIGTDSHGAIWLRFDPSMVPYSDRTLAAGGTPNWPTMVNRDTLDASIYSEITFPQQQLTRIHKVNASAFIWTNASFPQSAVLAVWPGGSLGYGNTEDQMSDLIVFDQTTLNQIVGNRAALVNNPMAGIRVRIPSNRDVYEPSTWSYVTLVVPAYLDPNGLGFTQRCIIKSRSKRLDLATGAVDIELALDAETYGQPGVTVPLTGLIIPPPPPPPGHDPGNDWSITFNMLTVTDQAKWHVSVANGNPPKGMVVGVGATSGPTGFVIQITTGATVASPCIMTSYKMSGLTRNLQNTAGHSINLPLKWGGVTQNPVPTVSPNTLYTDQGLSGLSCDLASNGAVEVHCDAYDDGTGGAFNEEAIITSITLSGTGNTPAFA